MIEYVIAQNPDDRILRKASAVLNAGGLVVFPTDTNWLVICDPFVRGSIEKLQKIKGEGTQKHFSFLCDSISTASEIAIISDSAFRLIKRHIPGHYTFLFPATKAITKVVKASKSDKEVGIRFPPSILASKLIEIHGKVLASTNLTQQILRIQEDEMIYSYIIEESLRGNVQMIIDPGEYEFVGPSTVISFLDDGLVLIREGAGDASVFGL